MLLQLIAAGTLSGIMGWIAVILLVAIGLGTVIFVHELGHFLVAKACGVKCEKFYIGFDVPIKLGFGKWGIPLPASLWKRQWGETEYGIGIIPLGGYVKMLGQDDNPANAQEEIERSKLKSDDGDAVESDNTAIAEEEIDPRSYRAKSVPQRMAIISAGVIMNVIFAFIFATIAYLVGVPETTSHIGSVVAGLAAYQEDIRPGDRIVAINGEPIYSFEQVTNGVVLGSEKEITLTIKRPGVEAPFDIKIKPNPVDDKRKRQMIGVRPSQTATLNKWQQAFDGTPAAEVADRLKPRDKVVAVKPEGQSEIQVTSYPDLEAAFVKYANLPLTLTLERPIESGDPTKTETVQVTIAANPAKRLGLKMKMGEIVAVQRDSPAEKIEMRPGDKIHAVNSQVVDDPVALPEQLRRLAPNVAVIDVTRKQKKAAETTAPEDVKLNEPKAVTYPAAGLPLDVPALGLAINVQNVVGGVIDGTAAAAYADELIGNQIIKIVIPPGKDGAAPAAEMKYWFGQDDKKQQRNNWPYFMSQLGYLPAGTPVLVWYLPDGAEKLKKIELALSESDEWFLPYRGLVFESQKEITKADSLGTALSLAGTKTKQSLLLVFRFLNKLRRGELSFTLLGGPITIARAAGHYAFEGFGPFLIFLTMLSANLAVLNFLPIPVLDGGHMVFLLLEGILRRPLSQKIVEITTWIGLLMILTLMIFVVGLDISRLF